MSVANTYTALQTFSSGLTSTGVITANGGITCTSVTVTNTGTITAGGLISANGGLVIAGGQTLTCAGTMTATTQAFANNSTNVATTAYVDKYQTWNLVSTYTAGGQTYTLPAQTEMNNIIISNIASGNTTLNITNPTASYKGQRLKFVNIAANGGGNLSLKFPTGSSVIGYDGLAFRNGSGTTHVVYTNLTNTNTLTFTYLNQTGLTWFMEV
jgi:hypothetical protein